MDFSYVVVDGSNIATEARSLPSLTQLDEAVRAFLAQHHVEQLTVIVDATFGHRIDPSEREEFDAAVANAEIITPPAGTVGRGDAFILQVAERAEATILSNDSFQEFHGAYAWLFDEARLMGGKPVPGIGWVFTARTPVRGAISRRSTREAKAPARPRTAKAAPASRSAAAKPKATTDSASRSGRAAPERAKADPERGDKRRRRRGRTPVAVEPLNELLPFLDFLGSSPPGSVVEGIIESYSSHGAYVTVGPLRCYVSLKSMGDPAPARARDVVNLGEAYQFTVAEIDTPRRAVDLAMVEGQVSTTTPATSERVDTEPAHDLGDEPAVESVAPSRRPRRRPSRAKATTALDAAGTTDEAESPAEEAPVSPVKKAATKKAAAKKSATKKAAAKKAPAKKAPARKAATKKAPAKKAPARKAAAKKAPARKAATKKAPAKKAPAKKAPARKAATKKAPAKKAPAKKAATKKAATKKAPARKTAARR